MKFRENEDAVSPVIGVILMVAITVILAAVIAAFVFGMTGSMESTKVVSMQAKLDGPNITLTISGGPDLATLQQLTITINGTPPTHVEWKGTEIGSTTSATSGVIMAGDNKFRVGDTITIKDTNKGRLLVVGKWSDGAEQIIIDHTY